MNIDGMLKNVYGINENITIFESMARINKLYNNMIPKYIDVIKSYDNSMLKKWKILY